MLANIRGGGEFGPAWHEAGLKTKRQLIYDDFIAVAEDLIARKITSAAPARHHGRLQRRPADGRDAHPAAGAVERRRHPGAAARHAPLSTRCSRARPGSANTAIRTIPEERGVPRKHLALSEPEAGRGLSASRSS